MRYVVRVSTSKVLFSPYDVEIYDTVTGMPVAEFLDRALAVAVCDDLNETERKRDNGKASEDREEDPR